MIFIGRNCCRNAACGVPAAHDEDGQLELLPLVRFLVSLHAEQQQG
jgi:hypothetical protein